MSRSLELGRAVLSSPGLNLELWLTTSITISPLRDQSKLQKLKSAQILQILSSGDFWICRGSGLHAKLHLTSRDEQLPPEQLQILSDALLQAPVWKQLLLHLSLPSDASDEPGIIRFNIRYSNETEALEELRYHRIFSQVPARDLKPPEGIETILFESVHFSMQLLDSRPSGRITNKYLKTAAGDKLFSRHLFKVPDAIERQESEMRQHAFKSSSIDELHTFQIHSTKVQPMQRKRKKANTKSAPLSSVSLLNELDGSRKQPVTISTSHLDQITVPSPSAPTSIEDLIDGALRLSINGSLNGKSSRGLKVKANTFHLGLADVAPALWRPGYLFALSQKSRLLETIGRSIDQIAHAKTVSLSLKHKTQRLKLLPRKSLDETSYHQGSFSSQNIGELAPSIMGRLWQQLQRNSANKSIALQAFIPSEGQATYQQSLDHMLEEMVPSEACSQMAATPELDDQGLAVAPDRCMLYGDFSSVLAPNVKLLAERALNSPIFQDIPTT